MCQNKVETCVSNETLRTCYFQKIFPLHIKKFLGGVEYLFQAFHMDTGLFTKYFSYFFHGQTNSTLCWACTLWSGNTQVYDLNLQLPCCLSTFRGLKVLEVFPSNYYLGHRGSMLEAYCPVPIGFVLRRTEPSPLCGGLVRGMLTRNCLC